MISLYSDSRQKRRWWHYEADENNEKLTIYLEMPGVARSDISISATSNELSVNAEGLIGNSKRQYQERFVISKRFDPNNAIASYEAGVLTLELPATDGAIKKIEVH